MKIVICGSMSALRQMVEIKKSLEDNGHEVIIPKNANEYASGGLQAEGSHESTKNKIKYDLIRRYYLMINMLTL